MDNNNKSLKLWSKLVNLTKGGAAQSTNQMIGQNIIEVLNSQFLLEKDKQQFPELGGVTIDKSMLYKERMKQARKDAKRQEPKYPDPEDCCNTNCNDCVFILYNNELEEYEKYCILNPSTDSESDDYCNYD